MGKIIHADFTRRQCTYTLDLRSADLSIRRETVFAQDLYHAQLQSVANAKEIGGIRSLMLYQGLPAHKSIIDKPLIVMLREDIEHFALKKVSVG